MNKHEFVARTDITTPLPVCAIPTGEPNECCGRVASDDVHDVGTVVSRYEFKERKSAKLKMPELIAYDDKGAAFIVAPFGMRKDVQLADIARIFSSQSQLVAALRAADQLIARYKEALDDCGQFLGGNAEDEALIQAALKSAGETE